LLIIIAENPQRVILMIYKEIKEIKEKMMIKQIIITEMTNCPKISPINKNKPKNKKIIK
jgi:hypothetical protein